MLCLHSIGMIFEKCLCVPAFWSSVHKYTCTMFTFTIWISFIFLTVFFSRSFSALYSSLPSCLEFISFVRIVNDEHIYQFCIVATKSIWATDDGINWLHFLWFCLFEFVYHLILFHPPILFYHVHTYIHIYTTTCYWLLTQWEW